MVPIEATVIPLPTELTTPPVTNIYFAIRKLDKNQEISNPSRKRLRVKFEIIPQRELVRVSFIIV
jgi:hypothetical protein